jgi:hypothetical protein
MMDDLDKITDLDILRDMIRCLHYEKFGSYESVSKLDINQGLLTRYQLRAFCLLVENEGRIVPYSSLINCMYYDRITLAEGLPTMNTLYVILSKMAKTLRENNSVWRLKVAYGTGRYIERCC